MWMPPHRQQMVALVKPAHTGLLCTAALSCTCGVCHQHCNQKFKWEHKQLWTVTPMHGQQKFCIKKVFNKESFEDRKKNWVEREVLGRQGINAARSPFTNVTLGPNNNRQPWLNSCLPCWQSTLACASLHAEKGPREDTYLCSDARQQRWKQQQEGCCCCCHFVSGKSVLVCAAHPLVLPWLASCR